MRLRRLEDGTKSDWNSAKVACFDRAGAPGTHRLASPNVCEVLRGGSHRVIDPESRLRAWDHVKTRWMEPHEGPRIPQKSR